MLNEKAEVIVKVVITSFLLLGTVYITLFTSSGVEGKEYYSPPMIELK